METLFYLLTMFLGMISFVMKITTPHWFVTFLGQILFKGGGAFVFLYAGVHLLKLYGQI